MSTDGRKIVSSHLVDIEPAISLTAILRTGEFDNQGSSQPWTWAWTTDSSSFEIWRPRGLYLRLDSTGAIEKFQNRIYTIRAPVALSIGKTGPISYGIIGHNLDGSKVNLVKDTYPFFDALMNVTYDGICEDEDFFPLFMMGRELATRLKIPFNETISP